MSSPDTAATVLVVDDEQTVADSFALRLERDYDVRTAYGGEDALATVDDDVDVVLLDRRMPDMSGDEVLERIREREYGCRVVMVTAVTPETDVVDLPVDDYLVKPVAGDSVFETIDRQLELAEADPEVAELAAVTAKLDILDEYGSAQAVSESDAYQRLSARAEELEERLDGTGGPAGADVHG